MLLFSALWFLVGCSGMSVPVTKPQSELFKEKENFSYITFARPFVPVGMAIPCAVTKFDFDTKETEFIGILYPGERIIKKVAPGVHNFYLSGGENDDYIQVQTKEGNMYYVSTYVSIGFFMGRTYFSPLHQSSYKREQIDAIQLTEPNENAQKYYNNHLQDYISEITEDYPQWSQEEYKEKLILPEYGFAL